MGEKSLRVLLDNDFWERAAVRPKKNGITNLARELHDYIIDTLGEHIDDVRFSLFGLGQGEMTDDTCIIIIEVSLEDETQELGAKADAVREVFDLKKEEIQPESLEKVSPKIALHYKLIPLRFENNRLIAAIGR